MTLSDAIASALREALRPDEVSVFYSPIPHRLDPSPTAVAVAEAAPNLEEVQADDGSGANDTHPIFYVGPSSLGLTNILMTHSSTPVRGLSFPSITREDRHSTRFIHMIP